MTNLYLIGNGFDLWHGLPTEYSQFYEFSKDTLDELESYYFPDTMTVGPWCDFENFLGTFDSGEFYDDHNYIDVRSENFKPSFVYCLEDDLMEQASNHVDAIRECFREWVDGIDTSVVTRRLVFSEKAQFLTFNYTSTLESVYEIDDESILHIHGRSEVSDELIFGHGATMEEEPELDENGNSNRTIFSDAESAAKYPFYALKKPVLKTLESNKDFFDSLIHVNEITIIGHSLNKIDLPYFRKLSSGAPNARWNVCLYSAAEKKHCLEKLVQCGALRERIQFCTYSDLEVEGQHGQA